jgi:hypothetical protein
MKFSKNLMKKVSLDPRDPMVKLWPRIFYVSFAVILLAGCRALPPLPAQVQDLGPVYHPSNIYRRANSLPPEVRRVAVLPLTTTTASSAYLQAGVETLEPLLYAELEKSKRFEVIPVTPQQMKQWTGQNGWRSDEQLPPDLFERVKAGTGCDAILFCQLTRYQPYPPLAVGWKFSLVQNPRNAASDGEIHPQILWSADEVMDAGDPSVTTGARVYYSQHLRNDAPSADPATMLSSPTRFGQYTLSTLLATLPERGMGKHKSD